MIAPIEKYNALLNITEKYPSLDAFKVIDAVSYEGDFDSKRYDKMLGLLAKGISFEAAKTLIRASCHNDGEIFDVGRFNLISEIADEAAKRKDIFLSEKNDKLSDTDVKDYILLRGVKINGTLKIVDKGTIIAAMGYKINKFDDFLDAAFSLNLNLKDETREQFLQIFYPSASELAQQLQEEIRVLKDQFSLTSKENLSALKKQINNKTSLLRKLLEQGKRLSPQDKIDRIIILSNFSEDEKLIKLISAIKDSILAPKQTDNNAEIDYSQEKNQIWHKKVLELISEYLSKAYNQKIEEFLHLSTNPYLAQLFKSIQDDKFRLNFPELLTLYHKDFETTLDGLHHNIATKQKFEKYGLDYEKWTKPDTSLSRSFYDGNNYVEIKQTNMRNVGHSLFLGNYAYVCTAIGGFHDAYAIPYIMNTLVGAVEVFVNGKPVGNSMIMPIIRQVPTIKDGEIVVGSYDKELAILIDDLKIVNPYNKPQYLQEIALFVEDIAKNIGIKEGKVYIADSNRMNYNKLKFSEPAKFSIIGSVLDPIWLNAVCKGVTCGNQEYSSLLIPASSITIMEKFEKESMENMSRHY